MLNIIRNERTNKYSSISEFKKLHELADSKPLTIVDNDGSLIYLNNAFEKMFGLSIGNGIDMIK